MRTTIDIPEQVYRELKVRAATEGSTIREFILEGVALRLHNGKSAVPAQGQPRFPVVKSRKPGSLKLGEDGVYEYIPFP